MKRPKTKGRTAATDSRPTPPTRETPEQHDRPASFRTSAFAIGAVALVVRLLHVWQMRDTLFFSVLMGDSRGYDAWARQLAAGDWIGSEVFYQAPLYPYFLGVVYALVGRDLLAVRLIQAVLGAVSSVALGYATRRLVSPAAGLVAGLMLALYPPAIFFDGLLQKSVLDVLFVCLSLAIIGHIVSTGGRTGSWLTLGITMAALSLTRENALALVAVVLVWAASPRQLPPAIATPRADRWPLTAPAAIVVGLACVLVPVAARNYAVGGGFYLTTSQFGSNLFIGNNPLADGSYMSLRAGRGSPEFERLDATELAEQASGRRLTPSEVSSYWTGRTIAFVRDQPAAWLGLLARKTRLLWSRTEVIDTESQESHADYSLPLRVLGPIWNFGPLLPLAVAGAWVLWPDRRRLWPLYALTAVYAASVILFFVVARYRLPLVPFVTIFAAAGAVKARHVLRSASARQLVAVAATMLVAAMVAFWPTESGSSRRAITENNLGTALQEEGRTAEAVERYQRALAFDADYAPALNNLGTALRAAGRVDDAVKVYGQALARDGDAANVHYNMGNALMAQGKPADAAREFQLALQANPRFVDALNNFGMALDAQGRLDDAIEAFRRATVTDPKSAIAFGNLGRSLATRGVTREAVTALEQSIALAPGNAETHYDLGSVLLELGALGSATTALRDAIRLKPDYAEAHNNLGIALASQGLMAEAVSHWREAVRLKPDFADARANLQKAGQKN
jgi:tetratricopeptide (TPR) repeat protein